MKILYSKTLDGICIQRCFGLDGSLRLPETVEGEPVVRLAPYLFSGSMARAVRDGGGFKEPLFIWDCEAERTMEGAADTEQCQDLPAVCGDRVQELSLPGGVRSVGAYAFYGCEHLERLEFWSTTLDWGAGVFTGCTGVGRLSVRIVPGERSCLKEVLSELRQALRVEIRTPEREMQARLVFPEFYEDAVENTPARIIMREVHGCGHMYRYSFDGTAFNFREYDRLFPYARAQEPEEAAARMALYRLCWPQGLTPEGGAEYRSFIREHPAAAARAAMADEDTTLVLGLAEEADTRPQLEAMIAEAGKVEDAGALALFMDRLHSRFGGMNTVRRKFEL